MKYLENTLSQILPFIIMLISPIKAAMIAISVIVIIDTVTGTIAAKKRGEQLTSNGFKRVIVKTVIYQISIITALITEKYLIDSMPVQKVVIGLLTVTELKSIFENFYTITGLDLFKNIIDKLHGGKK